MAADSPLCTKTDQSGSGAEGRPASFSLPRLIWKVKTGLRKKQILWADRLSLYPYRSWINRVEQPRLCRLLKTASVEAASGLSVGFVIAAENMERDALSQTIRSLQQSGALPWTVSFLIPETSPLRETAWFQGLLASDPRLKVVACAALADPADWICHVSRLAGGWLVPLSAGDQLAPAWAGLFCRTVAQNPAAEVIYWDEDRLTPAGARTQPFFKPDWSPALLISTDYLQAGAFRKELLLRVFSGLKSAPAGWVFQAAGCAGQVEHIASILQHRPARPGLEARWAAEAHARQAAAAFQAGGYEDVRAEVNPEGHIRVSWRSASPLVSIIIPTKNNLAYLERCLASLLEKTDYPAFEVILIDDHSTDPDVLAYYQKLLAGDARVRLFPNETAFNYSRVNNQGARLSNGELLLFLNNDTEILDGGWLSEMVRWALLPGVGAVGAKLLYPDRSIQHAGIVVGMTGHASHLYAGSRRPSGGLFLSPDVYRDVSAVTGACMLVSKAVFEQAGGFDESLKLVFNDVELCQRVRQAGYRVVYTPAAVLLHHEGRSRSRYNPPDDIRLGAGLLADEIERGDRYYNPNLSLAVNWPTLRRSFEPAAIDRLREIVKYKS